VRIPVHYLPNPFEVNILGTTEQLTRWHVSEAIRKGIQKSLPLLLDEDYSNVWLHAYRISYFVLNAEKLPKEPIKVDIQLAHDALSYTLPVDGWYILAKSIYVLDKSIDVVDDRELLSRVINLQILGSYEEMCFRGVV
jgi:hypothetical protein